LMRSARWLNRGKWYYYPDEALDLLQKSVWLGKLVGEPSGNNQGAACGRLSPAFGCAARDPYAAMLAVLEERERTKKKPGRPPDLTLEEQLVVALSFWREYRTHYPLVLDWQGGESPIGRSTRAGGKCAPALGRFPAAGQEAARAAGRLAVVVVDVSESPVEGPQKSSAPSTAARRSATPSRAR
jgi:hypothetical protein